MTKRRFALRISPPDAAAAGVEDGATAVLRSRFGTVEVPIAVSEEMTPGNVSLPWGWGHAGGWQRANAAGGANINVLHPSGPEHVEQLSGMSWLNGLPVRVERARARAPGP